MIWGDKVKTCRDIIIETQETDRIRDRKMLRLRCREIERDTDKTTKREDEIQRQTRRYIKM
jgi:hypothetical protein